MSEVRTVTEITIAFIAAGVEEVEELTDKVIAETGLPTELIPVYRVLVRWETRRRLREHARANAPVWIKQPLTPNTTAVASTSVTRPAWLRERFTLLDGRIVTWADATIADHESRIEMQFKLAGGIKRDIDNHKEAIRRCKAGGVDRLVDLPEYGGSGKSTAA